MAELTIALLIFLFPLAWSPGPGNMFFAANGARFGLRATLPANAGYHIATWLVTLAIGLGFAEMLRRSPAVLDAVRWAGAGYVLWLAWGMWRAGAAGEEKARQAGFTSGVLLLLLNPKAYVIIVLMLTRFAGDGGEVQRVVWITTLFTLNNLCAFLVWTLAGDRIGRRLRQGGAARKVNRSFALLLGAVALWMVAA